MKSINKSSILILLIMFLIKDSASQFNTSICGYIKLNELFYFINEARSDTNIVVKVQDKLINQNYTLISNFCHQLQYWCQFQKNVIKGSMIAVDSNGNCYQYQQTQIDHVDNANVSLGIKVTYKLNSTGLPVTNLLVNKTQITKEYRCDNTSTVGCPEVSKTTIWTFFQSYSLGYTIAIQIIGVIFMILGVYMYRVTLVILGWATSFIILLAIQQTVVFIPGVPDTDLANVMLITIICSFFVGYVMAYFPKAGLFCMGMWIGLIITLILNNVALYLIYSTPENLPLYIILPILCVAFGILTVCVKRKFIVFATSLIGAYACLRALSWHLGAFPNELLYPQQYQLGIKGVVTWQFYLYVVALLILTASSSALQFWLFKKKVEKTKQSADLDEHFDNMQNKLQNQRENLIQFQNIFKKLKQDQKKAPRILKRQNNDSDDDEFQIKGKRSSSYNKKQMSFEDSEEEDQQSEKQNPKKEPLRQNLLIKGTKKYK